MEELKSSRDPCPHHGNDEGKLLSRDYPTDAAPVKLGPFQTAYPFDSGLFSTLYRAHASADSGTIGDYHGTVALKVTNPSQMTPPHNSRREARLLESLRGHPNILRYLGTFTISSSSFVIVSPLMDTSLSFLLEKSVITARRSLRIVRDVLSGLAHLHSRGVLHRDIKPSNILLDYSSGDAVIADFGIAWSADDPGSEPSTSKICDVGTTSYRAPELLFGYAGYGTGVDMWAVGCVLVECIDEKHKSLFDSGDVGSELRLLASIFQLLGTPTLETWPVRDLRPSSTQHANKTLQEASGFPDFGKVQFHDFPRKDWRTRLPNASSEEISFLERIFQYESGRRISAAEVCLLLRTN